jgi:hypothetical protein
MEFKEIKTQEDAILWVRERTPFAIRPTRKAKTSLIYPFAGKNAFEAITECLGKSLFEEIKLSGYER